MIRGYCKKKITNQWEYRSGQIKIPYIPIKESLLTMVENFVKFSKSNKRL